MKDKHWTEQEIRFLLDNYSNLAKEKILEVIDKTWVAIVGKASRYKLKRKIKYKRGRQRIFKLNDNYFENIDSKDKAYFLGFLVADGYINKNRIILSLKNDDIDILETFKKYVEFDGVLHYIKPYKRNSAMYTLGMTSSKMTQDLAKLGVINKKTYYTYFPPIPEHLWSHFIRGVFDGDGCICISKGDPNASIFGTRDLISYIQEIIIKNCNVNKTKLTAPSTGGELVNLSVCGKFQVIRFRDYLYKDCGDLYLTRKKEKFDSLKIKEKRLCNCGGKHSAKGLCRSCYYKNYKIEKKNDKK